jgi:hypothetical protein
MTRMSNRIYTGTVVCSLVGKRFNRQEGAMAPGHTPPRIASRAESGGSRWLAWAGLVLALVFPLTYAYVVTVVLVRNLTPSGDNPFAT